MTEAFNLESQPIHFSKGKDKGLSAGGSPNGPINQNVNSDSSKNDAGQNDDYPAHKMPDEPSCSSEKNSNAWETFHGCMKDRDIAMCVAWREEIQQLLIFAGLFSGTVTAFIIESYKWLQPESDDITIQYLGFLTAQLAHAQNVTLPESLTRLDTSPGVTPSVIRINIFWFLSLIFNLSVVLIGILAYQWLREFQEEAPNLSHKEAVAFRQRKFQGLQSWHVPAIISSLPMLLQIALVLFFGGILDLLWQRSPVVAAVATVAVGAVMVFFSITTAAPALQCVRYRFRLYRHKHAFVPCPFKSTQSWIALHLILWIRGVMRRIVFFITKEESKPDVDTFFDWSAYDLDWRKQILKERSIHGAIAWMYSTWSYNADILDMLDRCLADLNVYDAEELVYKLIPQDHSAQEVVRRDLSGAQSKERRQAIMSIWLLEPHIFSHPMLQPRWVKTVLQTYGSDAVAYAYTRLWRTVLYLLAFGKFDLVTMVQSINSLCVRCDEHPDTIDGYQVDYAWRILRTLSWNSDDAHNGFWTDLSSKELNMHHFRFTCKVSKTIQTVLQYSKIDEEVLNSCARGILHFWPPEQGEGDILELSQTFPEFVNIANLVEFLEASREEGKWSPDYFEGEDWHRLTSRFERLKVPEHLNIDRQNETETKEERSGRVLSVTSLTDRSIPPEPRNES